MNSKQAYHVASSLHPLVLLEAEKFSSAQEDLKNQQTTIFTHFNQTLNTDECPHFKAMDCFGILVPSIM
jgi:hypothetical protein